LPQKLQGYVTNNIKNDFHGCGAMFKTFFVTGTIIRVNKELRPKIAQDHSKANTSISRRSKNQQGICSHYKSSRFLNNTKQGLPLICCKVCLRYNFHRSDEEVDGRGGRGQRSQENSRPNHESHIAADLASFSCS